MGTSEPVPQSAKERRAAEAELRALIDTYASANARLVGAVRRLLRKRLPAAHEVVYEYRGFFVISFSPSGHGYEGVLAVRAEEEGVKLYFNGGKSLPDPEKLLRGSGGMARWIAVEGAVTLKRPAVAALIEAAIAEGVPFAEEGEGAVVIRATTAKKKAAKAAKSKKKTK